MSATTEYNAARHAAGHWYSAELPEAWRNAKVGTPAFAELVSDFQAEQALVVDGRVGPITLHRLRTVSDRIRGCDVSGNNGFLKEDPIGKFAALAGLGFRYCWIKSSEGNDYAFRRYADWAVAAKAAGIHVGAYHFASATGDAGDAVREAEHFLRAAGSWRSGDMPPVLDIETNKAALRAAKLVDWCIEWLCTVERTAGVLPWVYTGYWFWAGALGKTEALRRWPLWIAAYPGEHGTFKPIPGWPAVCWQHTGAKGRIPGFEGAYDHNVLFCGEAALASAVGGG